MSQSDNRNNHNIDGRQAPYERSNNNFVNKKKNKVKNINKVYITKFRLQLHFILN